MGERIASRGGIERPETRKRKRCLPDGGSDQDSRKSCGIQGAIFKFETRIIFSPFETRFDDRGGGKAQSISNAN